MGSRDQPQTAYPDVKQWPPHEYCFENRKSLPTNEYTVGNIAIAAAAYGSLSAVLPVRDN